MSNNILRLSFLGFALVCSIVPAKGQTMENSAWATHESTNVWSFDVVPYLWLAGYEGTFGLPGVSVASPKGQIESADSFASHISAAAMLAGQVRYRDAGLFFDGAWLQLKTEGEVQSGGAYSGAEIKSDIAYGTLALSYRLPPLGRLQTDVLAGARVWHISNEIDFNSGLAAGFTVDRSRTWADPIIGASLKYDLTRHWFGTIIGDVGGFGVGSDISWSIFGGVGYRFTSWFSATLGYRYLHVDYDKEDFLMNANVQGLLLGLGFHF